MHSKFYYIATKPSTGNVKWEVRNVPLTLYKLGPGMDPVQLGTEPHCGANLSQVALQNYMYFPIYVFDKTTISIR